MTESVICLMGPTATGKTELALALAERFPIEIVSVDSAMIYRGFNIGSGKPSEDILKKYPHHLVDICDPSESYSAGQFREDALRCIELIRQAGKIPLLVGGTMLYFKVLQQGIANLPTADATLRDKILAEARLYGWEKLHQRLAEVDPVSASRIHVNDPQRLQRALEVYELTGKSLTEHWGEEGAQDSPYRFINLALSIERPLLHQRIEARFDRMLAEGFVEEVRSLLAHNNLSATLPSMKSVGYQQIRQYLMGEFDELQMREKAIVATRQLAKRQITWLRSWPELRWLDISSDNLFESVSDLL
jgi:tRNA dimethylallyltransferase